MKRLGGGKKTPAWKKNKKKLSESNAMDTTAQEVHIAHSIERKLYALMKFICRAKKRRKKIKED